jgi:hypothetical protein
LCPHDIIRAPVDARTQTRLTDYARKRGPRGFTFDDLAEEVVDTGLGADEISAWLMEGRRSGLLADLGSEQLSDGTVIGPQRYCLAALAPQGGHICGDRGVAEAPTP